MFTYYVATTPQTVGEILKTGTFPSNLPSWLEPKQIVCTGNISASIKTSNRNYHQLFILELATHLQLFAHREKSTNQTTVLRHIEPTWITRIFTYSEQAKNLLNHLLPADSTHVKLIRIVPEIYQDIPEEFTVSPITTHANFFSNKRSMTTEPTAVALPPKQKPKHKLHDIEFSRLSTQEEHLEILRSAFRDARSTILITSFAITNDTLRAAGIYPRIEQAQRRGVKIYCYYNDACPIEESIYHAFKRLGVILDETYTHSKILAVDHTWVAWGSFNWLSAIDNRYPNSLDASIVCRGEVCQDLIEDLWEYLKHYRRMQFGHNKQVRDFERQYDHTIVYEIAYEEELNYLTTLEQHLGFLHDIFEAARERIVICSPFISSVAAYREDIDRRLLYQTIHRGVDIFFVCSPTDPHLRQFSDFLASIRSEKIHLITAEHFHLKTIVIDDQLIAEGSFNWLSASRDQDSEFHNHETTIAVQGNVAKALIANFYSSSMGSAILEQLYGKAPGP